MNTNTINKQTATPHQPRMCSSVASQDHVLAMMVSPQVKIKIEPPTKKCKTGSDEPAPVIFDMTGLDDNEDFTVGASLDVIRKQHSLYFSYDPRGLNAKTVLPHGYCEGCRCPDSYCADKVFGSVTYDHAFDMLLEKGSLEEFDKEDWVECFMDAYTKEVEHKMRWNGIPRECGHCTFSSYKVAVCVRKGHWKKFKKDLREENKKEENYPDWEDLDLKEGEEIVCV